MDRMKTYDLRDMLALIRSSVSEVKKGTGLEVILPVQALNGFSDEDWELLVGELYKEGIVIVGQKQSGFHYIRMCAGGEPLALYGLYLELLGVMPEDEGDRDFVYWLKGHVSPDHFMRLVGVSMYYATLSEGGANAGAQVPEHIVSQAQQVQMLLSFREYLRQLARDRVTADGTE